MVDVQISEVDARLAPVKDGPWLFLLWYSPKDEQTLMGYFLWKKNKKDESGGRLKVKLYILFLKITHEPLHLTKDTGHKKTFYLNDYFDEFCKYDNGAKSLCYVGKTNYSV
jgi:hypothetical protein